ncbi:MAG: alpha/beta fold hydrolase, partial [Chloroflexi bacterium]|nr:alpha/beta fold hydrolase [Chloroflexota bacterium]
LDHMNTLRSFAGVLARAGVASLRYDKLGTGRTGHATRQDPSEIGFDLYLGEARAAYHFLATRPEIDPHRLIILGHSEGGLVALILASESLRDPAPRVLVLAAPPGLPILETIREQVARALIQQVQNQQITQAQADAALADLDRIIAQLKATGTIPSDIRTPGLATIFNPTNARYLTQEERYDPRTLATQVPRGLPVLVLHGKKDSQVTEADDKGLLSAFRSSGHDSAVLYDLANVDHVFKEVPGPPNPNPLVDYNNPALPFSRAAGRRLAAFLAAHL